MKWKQVRLMLLGSSAGITGLGLQNLNPFEPSDLTHWDAVCVGLILFGGLYTIESLINLIMYLVGKMEEKESSDNILNQEKVKE